MPYVSIFKPKFTCIAKPRVKFRKVIKMTPVPPDFLKLRYLNKILMIKKVSTPNFNFLKHRV